MLAFSADTRRADLERMAQDELDLLVVGGGITGVGVALDGASRGLKVALVERDDFAAGTSGRSSRLIHGGVRYLEHRDFAVVHECLRERAILLRLAPHLVRPIPMYVPTRTLRERALFRLGLLVYSVLALGRNVGRNRLASAREIHRVAPGLGLDLSGVHYVECRSDDARLTLEVARTARAHGGLIANHAAVDGLLGGDRVTGATVTDRLSGERLEVRSRLVVNAARVWADAVQGLAQPGARRLHPSKGVHLVFRPGAVDTRVALSVPSLAHDRRFVFVVPWGDRVYAGTTDTSYHGDLDRPTVTAEDRDYVVEAVAAAFPGVGPADVVASWAGLRPLLGETHPQEEGPASGAPPHPHGTSRTADLSRRHAIYEGPPGLLTITGGKLTAYRSMAQELVDRAAASLGGLAPSTTRSIPLGFTGSLPVALERSEVAARAAGVAPSLGPRMVRRFGDDWQEAMGMIARDRSLAEPLVDGLPVVQVEAELARTREMAMTEDDVMVRRTRLTTLDETLAARAAPDRSLRPEAPRD